MANNYVKGAQPQRLRGVGMQVSARAPANYIWAMIGRAGPLACALALGAMGGALLGGCGGGTQTVSVSGAPATGAGGAHAAATAHNRAGSTTTTGAQSTTPAPTTNAAGGGTGVPTTPAQAGEQATSTTHTAPAPAFVHPGGQSDEGATGAAAAAAQVVRAQGYTPQSPSLYHPNQTLRVLIGTRDNSTAGYNQRAFFFLDNRYLGTDSSQPSASVRVVGQSDTEVTLAYALYRPSDHECCPSGGTATVHFQLNNGQLVPLDPIPPASSASGLSRQ